VKRFKEFVVRNEKTSGSLRVWASTVEDALTICCSEHPYGGTWNCKDCKVVEVVEEGSKPQGEVT